MKKKITYAVWKSLEPDLNEFRAYYIPVNTGTHQISLIDSDSESDFFFRLTYEVETLTFRVEKKPASQDNLNVLEKAVTMPVATQYLRGWLQVLKLYDELVTIYDDPTIRHYEAEFFKEFVFENPNADSKPFDKEQQMVLLDYLHTVKSLLPAYQEAADETQLHELTSIEGEIDFLAKYVHLLSEKDAVKKMAKVWARGRKFSLSLIMEMLQEIKKEGFKTIAKSFVEGAIMKGLHSFLT